MDDETLVREASPAWLRKGLEALGTDCIDLYQVHRPDPSTPIRETAATLADLVRQGLSDACRPVALPTWACHSWRRVLCSPRGGFTPRVSAGTARDAPECRFALR